MVPRQADLTSGRGGARPGEDLSQLLALCCCQLQALAWAVSPALSGAQWGFLPGLAVIMLLAVFIVRLSGCLVVCCWPGELGTAHRLLVWRHVQPVSGSSTGQDSKPETCHEV